MNIGKRFLRAFPVNGQSLPKARQDNNRIERLIANGSAVMIAGQIGCNEGTIEAVKQRSLAVPVQHDN